MFNNGTQCNNCNLNALQVTADLPEAFSLLGFAFYLQPLMMPIIREMPEGKTGRNALSAAVHASVLGRRQGQGFAACQLEPIVVLCLPGSCCWARVATARHAATR
jgi:hypothetical protein